MGWRFCTLVMLHNTPHHRDSHQVDSSVVCQMQTKVAVQRAGQQLHNTTFTTGVALPDMQREPGVHLAAGFTHALLGDGVQSQYC
jgi:hypothetical protein